MRTNVTENEIAKKQCTLLPLDSAIDSSSAVSATSDEPPSKKKRGHDWDVDLEVYGREDSVATSKISSYSFEVTPHLQPILETKCDVDTGLHSRSVTAC